VTNPRPARQVSATRRIADADRDQTVARLSSALAEGRIDQIEFSDRAEAALRARFQADLDPLVADLDHDGSVAVGGAVQGRSELVKMSAFALVSAVVSLCAGIVVGDLVTGVLVWLVSLISAGVGLLIGRGQAG
jgi:hypothetical protein